MDKLGDWAEKYGWVIPILAIGVVLGLIFAERPILFGAVSSLGTLGAAVAAFWAVSLNSRDQRRKWVLEEAARQPHLIVSEASFRITNGEVGFASVTFTNLSQHPIHVRDAVVWSDDDLPDVLTVGVLVPASGTVVYKTSYDVHFIEVGGLKFMFNYAPTGPVLHSLSLPYRSGPPVHAFEGWPAYQYTVVSFELSDQELRTNVDDESKRAHEFVEQVYSQH